MRAFSKVLPFIAASGLLLSSVAQADNAKWPVLLHIQNFSGISLFLHDELCRKALQ